MLYWVFDLDLTLYQLPSNVEFSYKYLTPNGHLNYLLIMLPSKKLIFTNGTENHAELSLNKLEIKHNFSSIVARDTIRDLKPNYDSFIKFKRINKIKINDKCVFFDDLAENLISAKQHNWITVLINKNNYIHESIDFWFTNIYIALNFFICKIQDNL